MSEQSTCMKSDKNRKENYSLYRMKNIMRCKEDSEYMGEVILANEDLIWHSVHKYIGKPDYLVKQYCLDKNDILQLGRLGIIKAIKAFDTDRGVKFSSFAVITIVREINCFLRDTGTIIRPTRSATTIITHISRIETEFGYLPPVEELSILLGEDVNKIKKALDVGRPVKYLHEPFKPASSSFDAPTSTVLDILEDEEKDVEEFVIDKIYVETLLERLKIHLTSKEWRVLQLRMQGFNQTQTAEKLKISQMSVSRIMNKIQNIKIINSYLT
ncbi:hypothetical protein BRE01_17720 [Brevibacillus reuszeri]|uniref:RNA polymerase sigma factor n=1 Tax=Brevibacillus reuszeri TaxID=54915 RepID=A0A0K9Z0B6_9BACL|nr:sigma-70 family RNA polymerase sigma factor [Brevibacillus reuszeri]KNB74341.1 RNA polymerase sigma factor [Brevibacillus reuszeri]MED1856241.1 sigma-70 family RNA polymerase sigma factor [Brevibacillus reuszeri]GED68070.1 hypothetical protein BRE01_17720 [Brevibacillus reuszeri]